MLKIDSKIAKKPEDIALVSYGLIQDVLKTQLRQKFPKTTKENPTNFVIKELIQISEPNEKPLWDFRNGGKKRKN